MKKLHVSWGYRSIEKQPTREPIQYCHHSSTESKSPSASAGNAGRGTRNIMRWSLSSSLLCTILATAFSASPAFAKDSSDITQFGHDVRIEADQTADQVTCFGCSVYVRGQVAGDITTFGGNIVLEDGGRIAGEVTSFWGDVRAADNTKLAGDITVMGGSLRRRRSHNFPVARPSAHHPFESIRRAGWHHRPRHLAGPPQPPIHPGHGPCRMIGCLAGC